jgi:hypothetical protein
MIETSFLSSARIVLALTGLAAATVTSHAQTVYVVNSGGVLQSFDVSTPGTRTTIGTVGFITNGLDFRSGTTDLYGFRADDGVGTAGIYTLNTTTGAAARVGSGFATSLLGGSTSLGFDFNPTTLQGDGSIRIRLVGDSGLNLRLNSNTGLIANTDTGLNGGTTTATAVAYTRTDFAGAGTTALYYIDGTTDSLYSTSNPNGGVTTLIGALGVDFGTDSNFDIFTAGSINTGYASSGNNFYSIDLTNGAASLIGTNADGFAGGFAVLTSPIPEPSTYAALAGVAMLGLAVSARRRRV